MLTILERENLIENISLKLIDSWVGNVRYSKQNFIIRYIESYREGLLEWQAKTLTTGYIEEWDQLPSAKENFQVWGYFMHP